MVVVSKTGRSDKPVLSPTAQAVRHMCMNLRNVWSFLQPSINHTLVFREELFYSILRDIADPRWIELFKPSPAGHMGYCNHNILSVCLQTKKTPKKPHPSAHLKPSVYVIMFSTSDV